MTNITAVTLDLPDEPKSPEIHLRMSQSSFSVNTSDRHTKIIYFSDNTFQVSWMLWKTEFQLNSYLTMSSDKNFTKNLDRIITKDQQMFPGTISETQYASGNDWK